MGGDDLLALVEEGFDANTPGMERALGECDEGSLRRQLYLDSENPTYPSTEMAAVACGTGHRAAGDSASTKELLGKAVRWTQKMSTAESH